MKKNRITLFAMVVLTIATFTSFSCETMCLNGGQGTLSIENKSHNTVQKIMINGADYGTLDPGETKDIDLNPGVYEWQVIGIDGGTGCSPAIVTIAECETSAFSCSAK